MARRSGAPFVVAWPPRCSNADTIQFAVSLAGASAIKKRENFTCALLLMNWLEKKKQDFDMSQPDIDFVPPT